MPNKHSVNNKNNSEIDYNITYNSNKVDFFSEGYLKNMESDELKCESDYININSNDNQNIMSNNNNHTNEEIKY